MGWFKKKKIEEQKKEMSSLPEFPTLPEFPRIEETDEEEGIPSKLPSFPNNSLGEKFSQNTIKEAISGKKEGEDAFEIDDSDEDESNQIFQGHLKKQLKKEIDFPEEDRIKSSNRLTSEKFTSTTKKTEPIFIRIDKFEEGLSVFEKTKKQISEIEKMLKNIEKIKVNEEEELKSWEEEINTIKKQIERLDKELFSKVQ